jgi:hypothetical protein
MMRADVSRDIAERCLAYEITGVEAVCDWHDYLREKQDAVRPVGGASRTDRASSDRQ